MNENRWMMMYLAALIVRQGRKTMAALDQLEVEIARNRSVDESALALIQGIVAKLEEASGDPAKIAQLTADLQSSSDTLAAAVEANTPAADEEPA